MPRKLTTEEFIERSNAIHKNRYNYSKVHYVDSKTKVSIICPKHGEYHQAPNNHILGKGCRLCGIESSTLKNKKDLDIFIIQANRIHNQTYDYSDVNYINSDTKISIICKKHGIFNQKPSGHLRGYGCPSVPTHLKVIFIENQKKNLLGNQEIHTESYMTIPNLFISTMSQRGK